MTAISRINRRNAPTLYVLAMAAWVYGFAASGREIPSWVVVPLLLLPVAVHVGAGYVIGRWEALALAAVPVVLAVAAAGFGNALWIFLVLLMVFPGAPLIAAGVALRQWRDPDDDPADDLWF